MLKNNNYILIIKNSIYDFLFLFIVG